LYIQVSSLPPLVLTSSRSEKNQRIQEAIAGRYGKTFTSDHVFDESVTKWHLYEQRILKEHYNYGERILNSEIAEANRMSFTDRINIALMKRDGVDKIMAFDRGFENIQEIKFVS